MAGTIINPPPIPSDIAKIPVTKPTINSINFLYLLSTPELVGFDFLKLLNNEYKQTSTNATSKYIGFRESTINPLNDAPHNPPRATNIAILKSNIFALKFKKVP